MESAKKRNMHVDFEGLPLQQFVGRRPVFVAFLEKWLTCCIPTPCHGIQTAFVVCFSFKGNMQQIIFVTNIAGNAAPRSSRAFSVFEYFPLCTWIFAEHLNNYHGNRRL